MADDQAATVGTGDPTRYAYAHAARLDLTLPPERAVETALRSQTGVREGPIPREKLDAVTGFWLHLSRPADFAPLARLGGLEWLALTAPFDFDLATLVDALTGTTLRSLHIEAPLTDLGPLSRMTGLTNLRLQHIETADLSPLSGLTGLDDLGVSDAPVADLAPLAGLRLNRLFVYDTQVTEVGGLAGMPTLRVLGLAGCPLRDLTGLDAFPGFMHVNLSRTPHTEDSTVLDMLLAGRMVFDLPADEDDEPNQPVPASPRTPAEVLAEYRGLAEDDDTGRWSLQPALLATRDPEAVGLLLADVLMHSRLKGAALGGMLLQGGLGDVPFPENPWGVTPSDGLDEALNRIWEPLDELSPQFTATARARTLALVHVTGADGEPALVYLTWGHDDDRYTSTLAWQPKRTGVRLDALDADVHVRTVIGTAPRMADPDEIIPLLAGPIPRPLQDLWAVHHSLGGGFGDSGVGGELGGNVLSFCDGDWEEGLKRTGGTPPDRLITEVGRGDFHSAVLDLDMLDAAGNPTVANWAWKEWGTGDHRQFWDWLDDEGTRLVWL